MSHCTETIQRRLGYNKFVCVTSQLAMHYHTIYSYRFSSLQIWYAIVNKITIATAS